MGILIRGGRIIDAATDTDKIGDIYLEDGMIKEIGDQLTAKEKSDRVIDASGLSWLCRDLIDPARALEEIPELDSEGSTFETGGTGSSQRRCDDGV